MASAAPSLCQSRIYSPEARSAHATELERAIERTSKKGSSAWGAFLTSYASASPAPAPSSRCPFRRECARHHGHVLVTKTKIDCVLPLISQVRQGPEPVIGGLQGEPHILESER